jgi:hypothetical protein
MMVVLTKDNLTKRRNVGDRTCLFCAETEYVSHLFFKLDDTPHVAAALGIEKF